MRGNARVLAPLTIPFQKASRLYGAAPPDVGNEPLLRQDQEDDAQSITIRTESPKRALLHQQKHTQALGRGTYRERIRFYMDRSPLGRCWELLDTFINVVFVASYISLTFFSLGSRGQVPHPPAPPGHFLEADLALACILLLNWLPNVYLSFDPVRALYSDWFSLLSLLATIPVIWASVWRETNDDSLLMAGDVIFLYPFRFWRLHVSFMRILTPDSNALFTLHPVTRKATKLGLSICSTLTTVTAWVHICLYRVQKYYDLSFFDVFYTIAVSCTSGLATQIIPDNAFSRIVTLYVMIVGAIFIPKNLADLLNLIRSQSSYLKPFRKTPGYSHIVLTGNFEVTTLRAFLTEFFNKDHGPVTMRTRIVMLSIQDPSPSIEALLKSPFYTDRVTYIKGNPLSFPAMAKARLESASACFVFQGQTVSEDEAQQDSVMVMQCLALRKYSKSVCIYAEALRPESRFHLQHIAKEVICVQEFLSDNMSQRMNRNPQLSKASWVQEYLQGARMEIYGVPLSDNFIGFDYTLAACNIFEKYGSILFGVKIVDPTSDETKSIFLNPQGYVFRGGEIGYFIATNARDSATIAQEGPGMEGPSYFDHDSPLSDRSRISRVSPNAPSKHGSQEDIIPISPNANQRDAAVLSMEQEDVKQPKQKGKDQSFRDHILVCDLDNKFPSTLASFLGPLRVREPRRSVVILCTESPSKQQWSKLETFGNVRYVQGSSLSRADLKKANVETAWKAVILAKEDKMGDRSVDAPALVSVLNIQSICSNRPEGNKIFIMVEFIFIENMKYIGRGENYYSSDLQAQLVIPSFVSGQVFCPSVFHSTLCQVYYNDHIMDILRLMVYNYCFDNVGNHVNGSPFPGLHESVKNSGYVSHESVPKELVGVRYMKLFTHLMKTQGKLCIGLYRRDEGSDPQVWFVSLNPHMDIVVRKTDFLFVFGRKK